MTILFRYQTPTHRPQFSADLGEVELSVGPGSDRRVDEWSRGSCGEEGLLGGTLCWTADFLSVKLRRGDAECGGERLSLGSSRVVAARVSKHAAWEDHNRVIRGIEVRVPPGRIKHRARASEMAAQEARKRNLGEL